MNYATIKYYDIANGPGVRTSIFVSGCRHHCPGCFNEVAWDFGYGQPFDKAVRNEIFASCQPDYIAGISLLVGGIGVMNIMLVSVTERTREIGIRKSLGARTGSIMLQFLSESAIITLLGGVIGIILGVLGANVVCGIMGFTASVSPLTVLVTTLFSSGVGLFFGIYPAKKAAKLSPIEALRHE